MRPEVVRHVLGWQRMRTIASPTATFGSVQEGEETLTSVSKLLQT